MMEEINTFDPYTICCICYVDTEYKTQCSHVLCCFCYKILHKKICPICRADITNDPVYAYKRPKHIVSDKYDKIKKKISLHVMRKYYLSQLGIGKKYRNMLFKQLHYAHVFYYKGIHYDRDLINGYYRPIDLLHFFEFLLQCEKWRLPESIRLQYLNNIRGIFEVL